MVIPHAVVSAATGTRGLTGRVSGSFRDPNGFVFLREGVLLRQVDFRHAEHYDHLMSSGLYRTLVEEELLVAHEEEDLRVALSPDAYRVLRPEPVPFISHPYEWCFGQLQDAARATLRIQEVALDHGMSLRDASAFNIQFLRGRPVLIDTLSFERLREGQPWVAYRQFCQHFLAPLALSRYRDPRLLKLLRLHVEGVPLDLAARLLPARARLRPGLAIHLFAHARGRRHGKERRQGATSSRPFSLRAFRGLIDSLRRTTAGLDAPAARSTWSGYYEEQVSYQPQSSEHKKALVASFLDQVRPRQVWDLGSNAGTFARIAAQRAVPTVAFDLDHAVVEATYREVRDRQEQRLLPLVLDLANPSPGVGWDNRERLSLTERGPADMALALALTHHLAMGNNVPFDRLAEFMAGICRWLVVEFVPREDPMVRRLMAGREDVFLLYTKEEFERAFGAVFVRERTEAIRGSDRTLYLMRRR